MDRKLLIIAAITIIAVIGLFIGSRSCEKEQTPEDKVRRTIFAMEEAVESKDRKAFLSYISKDYKDNKRRKYGQIQEMVTIYFLQYEAVSVIIKDLQIELQGNNKADVGAFRGFNRADPPVMGWMHIPDFKTGAFTSQPAGSKSAKAPFMSHF